MQQESRVKKTVLNAKVSLAFYFLTLILSFFSRKVFLDGLGADFIGLTGTLQNLLGFLNIAELGIEIAIGYLLYQPLFDRNKEKLCDIITVMGYLYRKIGYFILISGIILSAFLPLIFPDTGFNLGIIYFAYYSFLASSLIGYFLNYKQNLLGADQKGYVVAVYYNCSYYLKVLIQMAVVYYTKNYYLWIALELILGITYSCILNWKIRQTYPWLKTDLKHGRQKLKENPMVMKKTKQIFFHKIAGFAQLQTTPFLIYAFVSLHTVALYGSYTILFDKANNVIDRLFGSVGAGVGNLIAENNKEKTLDVFWQLFALRYAVISVVTFGFLNFTNDFIRLWLGDEYILSNVVLYLLVLNQFLSMSKNINDPFIWGKGMFGDVAAPACEALIYILVALVGGHFLGLPGVILGNTVSLFIIICLWKPYYLFNRGLHVPLSQYVVGWCKYTSLYVALTVSSFLLMEKVVCFTPQTWLQFVLYSASAGLTYIILCAVIYYVLSRRFRQVVGRFIKKKWLC